MTELGLKKVTETTKSRRQQAWLVCMLIAAVLEVALYYPLDNSETQRGVNSQIARGKKTRNRLHDEMHCVLQLLTVGQASCHRW